MLTVCIMQLREKYLKSEPMSSRKETYATIANALKTLDDPFTRFLEPSRYQALKRGNQGSVIGVGLEVAFAGGADSQLVVNICYIRIARPCYLSLHQNVSIHRFWPTMCMSVRLLLHFCAASPQASSLCQLTCLHVRL